MDIEEIRKTKEVLEEDIIRLIQKFESDTGVVVENITVQRAVEGDALRHVTNKLKEVKVQLEKI